MRLSFRPGWASYVAIFVGITMSILLGARGIAQSLTGPGDVGLVTDSGSYDIGDTVIFNGSLKFALGELATTTAVRLSLSGP
ncbi:hypothetical protein IID10_00615, partial [candidate division KSB1 bacterium]|nr:hypothetical protein [candidate division KSB1 bacterium]